MTLSKSQRRKLYRTALEGTISLPGPAIDIEAQGEDEPATFTMLAYSGGLMHLKQFSVPVVADLTGMSVSDHSLPILRDHDGKAIVGHTTQVDKSYQNIRLSGIISGTGQAADEVIGNHRKGFRWQASIGAQIKRINFIEDRQTVTVNGRSFRGPLLVARETVLREVSFVANGADDATSVSIAASIGRTDMEFVQWLKDKGFEADKMEDSQVASMQAMYDADIAAAADDGNDGDDTTTTAAPPKHDLQAELAEERKVRAAERRRVNAIEAFAGKYKSQVTDIDVTEEKAIEAGWSADEFELHCLREARTQAPAVHSRSSETNAEMLEAALMLRAGVDIEAKHFQSRQAVAMKLPRWLRAGINDDMKQKALEAGHRMSGSSMVDLCRYSLMAHGQDVPFGREDMIRAAFSGGSLTNIFTTNMSTVVLDSYSESMDTTMGWCSEQDVQNFKVNERPRVVTGEPMEELPRGGEAAHWTRSDTAESYRIKRFARQFVVDEQDIIDDNFDALQSVPADIGRAAARVRPDLVYSIIYANAALSDGVALFSAATHVNLLTTATLADPTLRAAISAMAVQTENGVNLNINPTHLIVAKGLLHTARQLINSSEVRGMSAQIGTRNPLIDDDLTPVSDARLDNGVTDPVSGTVHAGAPTTWYLASSQAHTIEVGYLAGQGRAPSVRLSNLTDGRWGLNTDVKIDIGAKALDFRGLHKNTA